MYYICPFSIHIHDGKHVKSRRAVGGTKEPFVVDESEFDLNTDIINTEELLRLSSVRKSRSNPVERSCTNLQ